MYWYFHSFEKLGVISWDFPRCFMPPFDAMDYTSVGEHPKHILLQYVLPKFCSSHVYISIGQLKLKSLLINTMQIVNAMAILGSLKVIKLAKQVVWFKSRTIKVQISNVIFNGFSGNNIDTSLQIEFIICHGVGTIGSFRKHRENITRNRWNINPPQQWGLASDLSISHDCCSITVTSHEL